MSETPETLAQQLSHVLRDARPRQLREADHPKAVAQAEQLLRLQLDRRRRTELLRRLQERRQGRDDLVQVEAADDDAKRLGVPGELLMWREDFEQPEARRELDAEQPTVVPLSDADAEHCPELGDLVVRLRMPNRGVGELERLGRRQRGRGMRASVNHVTPLGPVAKGEGGPEPLDGAAAFRPEPVAAVSSNPPVVAIIDTGIASDRDEKQRRTDGWLVEVVRTSDNIDHLNKFSSNPPGPGPDEYLDLGAGHGTFAAGVVRQVAPGAEIKVYHAIDSDGVGSELAVACAMIRAVKEGAHILNLSLGTQTLDDHEPVALGAALQIIRGLPGGRDVLIVAAAGNFADTHKCWPAAFSEKDHGVVAVAALTAGLQGAAWSSRGPWVTCSTIGEGIISTYVTGTELDPTNPGSQPPVDQFGPNAWAIWSGTSFATPQVAGAVAREWQVGGSETPREVFDRVVPPGNELSDFGRMVKLLPGVAGQVP
jgi:subtilase family protein